SQEEQASAFGIHDPWLLPPTQPKASRFRARTRTRSHPPLAARRAGTVPFPEMRRETLLIAQEQHPNQRGEKDDGDGDGDRTKYFRAAVALLLEASGLELRFG